MHKMNK